MIRIHQIAAETVPHIFLLQAEAVHLILHPADHQAPRTADPVAIQFLQGAQAVDQCLPDLTAQWWFLLIRFIFRFIIFRFIIIRRFFIRWRQKTLEEGSLKQFSTINFNTF
jgi:hypothetical protein